jgi:hypothetical protein
VKESQLAELSRFVGHLGDAEVADDGHRLQLRNYSSRLCRSES